MTRLLRRIYTGFAITLFLILAPLVVAWTSGYRWTGWRSGFSQTGSLYITSQPRATLLINGESQGQVPQRLAHLTPGSYTIELQRDGYSTWKTTVRVTPSSALTIGPVQMYPSAFAVTNFERPTAERWLSDQFRTVYGQANGTAGEVWPNLGASSLALPFTATGFSTSAGHQNQCFTSDDQAAIFSLNQAGQPWLLPGIGTPQWDMESPSLLYALQERQVVRLDALKRTVTILGPADSFALIGDTIWSTLRGDASTTIFRQQTFGQATPTKVSELAGRWSMNTTVHETIVIQNEVSHEALEGRFDNLTNVFLTSSLGQVDQLWWPSRSTPPLWLTGSDLLTFDTDGQPLLLDRSPQSVSLAAWVVPGHILLTVDDHRVRIQSVSDRQGRGLLLEQQFDETITPLGVDTSTKTVVIRVDAPDRLLTLHW